MGGAQARRLCPRRGRRPAADVGVHGGQQGDVRGLRRHDAARRGPVDRRGVPRRPRDGADRRARRPRSPCGLRRDGARATSGCRSRSAWRGRSSSPRSRARWRSPTACSSCRPTASSSSCIRSPVERLWGVGPVTAAQAPRARHHAPSARSRRCSRTRSWLAARPRVGPAPARARAQPRPAAGCESGRRRGSIGSQRALGRSPTARRGDRRHARRARRPRHPPDARRRAASGARSCCGCASTTSRARRARTRCRGRRRRRRRSSTTARALLARATPLIERRA